MLAHNWIFGKLDASGSAGIESGAGNRCGKEGLGVKKGTENMEREGLKAEVQPLLSWHGEREGTHSLKDCWGSNVLSHNLRFQ